MFGAGTLINAAAIVIGGILGLLFGKLLKKGLPGHPRVRLRSQRHFYRRGGRL